MKRAEIHSKIIAYLKRFGARRIGIFGSFARNEQNPKSDLDILISFSSTLSLLQLVRIERELSEILGIKVDLVTEPSLKNKKLRKYIEDDLQIIYEQG